MLQVLFPYMDVAAEAIMGNDRALTRVADGFMHQREIHVDFVTAPDGYVKYCPTAAIFPQKCGRWHFQIAVGRE